MWQRFTQRARSVIFFAQEEAGRLGENYVSTEHLLLGLIREDDNVAVRILDGLGIPASRVRSEIERIVVRGEGRLSQDMELTPRSKQVVELSYEEARELGDNYIGTEHLLLGMIREGEGAAGQTLIKLGANLESVRQGLQQLRDKHGSEEIREPVKPSTVGSERFVVARGVHEILADKQITKDKIVAVQEAIDSFVERDATEDPFAIVYASDLRILLDNLRVSKTNGATGE